MYIPSFPTYLSVYILTKSEFISSCIRPAVGANIVQITRSTFCKCFFFKWPPVAILDVQKSLLTISDHYHNFYFCELFNKMAAGGHFGCPRLTMAFLAISDQYKTFYFIFYKMAAGAHFGCPKFTFDRISGHFRSICNLDIFDKMAAVGHFGSPKFTFDRISGHFRSIRNFYFFGIFLQNGHRRPFWMSEIHFRSHFWPFQIDMEL